MPRKYHKPPSTKRRKSKKSTTPNVLEPLPESQTDHSASADEEAPAPESPAANETAVDVDEYEEEREEYVPPATPAMQKKARPVRHLVADYTYVLSELRLSVGLALFLIVALVITGILR